jgi:hypothetical protein
MESSIAKSNKDEAKEEERWSGIDISKTRRRIEDTLRKGDPETIIKIAEILGVKIAEQLPEELEIVMADVWEELNKVSFATRHKLAGEGVSISDIQNKILSVLPKRFNIYFLIRRYDEHHWSRVSRDFFTKEAAEKHRKQNPYLSIKVNYFNVIQMRMTIKEVMEDIKEGVTYHGEKVLPLEPDEEVRIKQLKRILYPQ